jgi:hypothetical protein
VTVAEEVRMKAAAWSKEVADLLRDAMPGSNAARLPLRTDTAGAVDLEVPVFRVASRVGLLPNVRRALREARHNAPLDRLPLAVIKDETYQQTFAAMPLDSFLLLVSGWWAATQPVTPPVPGNVP